MFEIDEGLKDKFNKCQKEINREARAKNKLRNKREGDINSFIKSFATTLNMYLNIMDCDYIIWNNNVIKLDYDENGIGFIDFYENKMSKRLYKYMSNRRLYDEYGSEEMIKIVELAREKAEKKYSLIENYAYKADQAEAINEVFL